MSLVVRFLRLPHAGGLDLPAYESAGAAGMDLRAAVAEDLVLMPMERKLVPTGLCMELPAGHEAQIRPRSGLAIKNGITLINSPGTVDEDYRGELHVPLVNLSSEPFSVTRGMRIAQMIIAPVVQVAVVEVKELGASDRGAGGFGSTGTG